MIHFSREFPLQMYTKKFAESNVNVIANVSQQKRTRSQHQEPAFTAGCEYEVVGGEASLLPSGSAVCTYISPKDSRSLQGKVTSAALLETQSFGISFPFICSSYLKSTATT